MINVNYLKSDCDFKGNKKEENIGEYSKKTKNNLLLL